jgi:hypothetical protein
MFISIRKFIHACPAGFGIGVIRLAILCHLFVAVMARAQHPCAAALREAEQNYFAGDFDVAISLTLRCLNENELADSTAVQAYRLLAMTYLAKDDSMLAGQAIRNLLQRRTDYAPDPMQEPPSFVNLVDRIKQQLSESQRPEQTRRATANAKKSLKPWAAGGVLAGVAILVVLWPLR